MHDGNHDMVKKRLLFLVFGVSLFVSNCAGPGHQLMPGYKKIDVKNAVLGVILVKKDIVIGDPEELARMLGGGDATQLWYNFFGDAFPKIFKARSGFKEVEFLQGADENMRRTQDGPADLGGGGNGTMTLPAGRHYVNPKYQYLLILELYTVQRNRNTGVPMLGSEGAFMGLSGGSDNAAQSATFIMWDNAQATIVAYGNVKEKIATGGEMTRQTLLELMNSVAASISRGMPYRK
jgi:hypothetical protein